tara:strand:- start:99 stop:317 length:219 start_codon:yes stop_codon:yes gene_type:complete
MEQISNQPLQNKATAMVACLELIKLNIKSNSKEGLIAQGSRKLKLWKHYVWKTLYISANMSFWIFILYNIFS